MERKRRRKRIILLVYHNILPVVFFSIFIFHFFHRLFYPAASLFMIPDFGESDVLHLNIPFKEILSKSLKNGYWPLWSHLIGGGFPILAEGQIGTFYLPNLILFRFLPTVVAYNLNLVISYLLSGLGIYLLGRNLGLLRVSSLFAAIVFTFSGFLAVHLNHFNLIQAASLLPLIILSFCLVLKKPSFKYAALLAFILSQQIFTGHFYIVFITIIGIIAFLLFYYGLKLPIKTVYYIFLSVVLTFGLSAIQLFPTFELLKLSSRSKGLDFETVTSYPYPFKHLITFFSPYFFGDPAKGTYPSFGPDWGIFWENTAYVGILPLILAIFAFLYLREKIAKTFFLLLFLSLLLVLGKNSPLYFLFSMPPFNFFRVPSKFLLLTVFSLSILSAFTFDKIFRKIKLTNHPSNNLIETVKTFLPALAVFVIFILVLIDGYRFSYNYPPSSNSKEWLSEPEAVSNLEGKEGRIISLAATIDWNNIFLKNGWQDITPFFYLRNFLYHNYNAIFSLPSIQINTGGLIPRRTAITKQILETVNFDNESKTASISAVAKNMLSLTSTRYLISSFEINNHDFVRIKTINSPKNLNLKPIAIYEYKKARPRAYLTSKIKTIKTLEDFYRELSNEDTFEKKTVFVEDDEIIIKEQTQEIKTVKTLKETENDLTYEVETNKEALFVIADSYHPGWRASIDDHSTKIFKVNLNQKGIIVPTGRHKIRFFFRSNSFEGGKIITVCTSFIIFLALTLGRGFFPRKVA